MTSLDDPSLFSISSSSSPSSSSSSLLSSRPPPPPLSRRLSLPPSTPHRPSSPPPPPTSLSSCLFHHIRSPSHSLRTHSILGIPYSDVTESYCLGTVLGEGVGGIVRNCTAIDDVTPLACKTVRKKMLTSVASVRQLKREVRALREAGGHPNVVEVKDVVEDETNVHIIMELCEGGDLFDRIKQWKRFTEGEASHVTHTVLSVLRHIHSNGIAHRDIKPENILMKSWTSNTDVKIVDFGQAEFFTPGQKMTKPVGSKYYVAPEVLACNYGPEADIWSVGVTLYILLCGSPPFMAKKQRELFQKIKIGKFDIENGPWRRISNRAKHLVLRMLCLDPARRITASEALSHPWILQHCGVYPATRILPLSLSLRHTQNFAKCRTVPAPPSLSPIPPPLPPSSPHSPSDSNFNSNFNSSFNSNSDLWADNSPYSSPRYSNINSPKSFSPSSLSLSRTHYTAEEATQHLSLASLPSSLSSLPPLEPLSPSKHIDIPSKASSRLRFCCSPSPSPQLLSSSTPSSPSPSSPSWSQKIFSPFSDMTRYNNRAKNIKCTFRLSSEGEGGGEDSVEGRRGREREREQSLERGVERGRRSSRCFRSCGTSEREIVSNDGTAAH